MIDALRKLNSMIMSAVTRATNIRSAYSADGQRTMLQVSGFDNEIFDGVELILPYGMSAKPIGSTAEYLIFQVNGTRDHKVAQGGDDPALRIPDLQAGEYGFRDAREQQVVFRLTKIEITTSLGVTVNGNLTVTGEFKFGGATKKIALDGDPVIGGGGGNVQASSAEGMGS